MTVPVEDSNTNTPPIAIQPDTGGHPVAVYAAALGVGGVPLFAMNAASGKIGGAMSNAIAQAGFHPAEKRDALCRRRKCRWSAAGDRFTVEPGQSVPAPGRTEAAAGAGIHRRPAL